MNLTEDDVKELFSTSVSKSEVARKYNAEVVEQIKNITGSSS